MEIISIRNARYAGGYKLALEFSDGTSRTIDFEPFLRSSHHPEIAKYLNLNQFKKFQVVDGDLDWNDMDLLFPITDLYSGQLLHGKGSDSQAS